MDNGDTLKRRFTGCVAQCGCRWERVKGFGDVLRLCPMHDAWNTASYEQYERERLAKLTSSGR